MDKFLDHAQHALDTAGKHDNLALGLVDIQLAGAHQTTLDILQLEFLVLLLPALDQDIE